MLLKPSETFGPFTVLREIGRGAMAVVYEAEHRGLEKRVALKVLNAPADDAERRFLREGVAAARIRHEHIVEVHDTGVRDGTAYLVMELLHGESLGALIRREGPLSAERVADLLLPVLSALSAAHDVGVVHRDLKPENLFLSRSRHGDVVPKVVDFGLARLTALDGDAQRLTGSSALVGSVAYMSPEQVLNADPVGPASDQYALGVVMYECVTGQLPLLKPSVFATLSAILKGRIVRPSTHVPALDPRLDGIIVRAMAREPTERFASLRVLGAALFELATPAAKATWAREFGHPTTPSIEPSASAPRPRPSPSRAWAVALALVTLAGGAAWYGARARDPCARDRRARARTPEPPYTSRRAAARGARTARRRIHLFSPDRAAPTDIRAATAPGTSSTRLLAASTAGGTARRASARGDTDGTSAGDALAPAHPLLTRGRGLARAPPRSPSVTDDFLSFGQ